MFFCMLKLTCCHDGFDFVFVRARVFLYLVLILGCRFVALQEMKILCKRLYRSEQIREKQYQNMENT